VRVTNLRKLEEGLLIPLEAMNEAKKQCSDHHAVGNVQLQYTYLLSEICCLVL
jgi:hypothetical protein